MRQFLIVMILLVSAAALAACGGPSKPAQKVAEACERQVKEVEEMRHEGGDSAKSSDEADEAEHLVECARQAPAEATPMEDSDAHGGDEPKAEEEPVGLDPDAREAFVTNCGTCHALADAETEGAAGPPLDDVELSVEMIVKQILEGGGLMPAIQVSQSDADAIAAYVAAAAGGSEAPAGDDAAPGDTPAADAAPAAEDDETREG